MDRHVDLPAVPDLRLRAMNIGQLLFELAPQDALSKAYREWATLVVPAAGATASAEQGTMTRIRRFLQGV